MKKTTLLIAALLVGAVSYAQNPGEGEIVINREVGGTTGLISTVGEDFDIYVADHFELTEDTKLGEFSFIGFGQGAGNGYLESFITGLNVFVWKDDGAAPLGNPAWGQGETEAELELWNIGLDLFTIDESEQGRTVLTVNVANANNGEVIELPAGEYWVSAAPSVEGSAGGAGRWNWIAGNEVAGEQPLLIDPEDAFGEGATFWYPISELITEPFQSAAWSLTTHDPLGVEDVEATTFKHLVQNDQLLLTSDVQINDVTVYNSLGQLVVSNTVNSTSGSIDLSTLTSGIYFSKINLDGQEKTIKFVK